MPSRYQSFTGLENMDAEDLQEMRENVAAEFNALISSIIPTTIEPQQPK